MLQSLLLTTIGSDSLPVFAPFVNLPSRTLVDYYKVIRNPVCLKSAQKAVRGIKGRDKPTGTTFLKSWGAFEEELSHIWENARIYNEDGSDISELAGELEVCSSRGWSVCSADRFSRNISIVVWQRQSALSRSLRNRG